MTTPTTSSTELAKLDALLEQLQRLEQTHDPLRRNAGALCSVPRQGERLLRASDDFRSDMPGMTGSNPTELFLRMQSEALLCALEHSSSSKSKDSQPPSFETIRGPLTDALKVTALGSYTGAAIKVHNLQLAQAAARQSLATAQAMEASVAGVSGSARFWPQHQAAKATAAAAEQAATLARTPIVRTMAAGAVQGARIAGPIGLGVAAAELLLGSDPVE